MTVYCVSYDLNKTGQNYTDLHAELKNSPSWWHHLDSTWLIFTAESAEQLFSRLARHIDSNDQLLIVKVAREYQGWLSGEAWKWINEHVTDR